MKIFHYIYTNNIKEVKKYHKTNEKTYGININKLEKVCISTNFDLLFSMKYMILFTEMIYTLQSITQQTKNTIRMMK